MFDKKALARVDYQLREAQRALVQAADLHGSPYHDIAKDYLAAAIAEIERLQHHV